MPSVGFSITAQLQVLGFPEPLVSHRMLLYLPNFGLKWVLELGWFSPLEFEHSLQILDLGSGQYLAHAGMLNMEIF